MGNDSVLFARSDLIEDNKLLRRQVKRLRDENQELRFELESVLSFLEKVKSNSSKELRVHADVLLKGIRNDLYGQL